MAAKTNPLEQLPKHGPLEMTASEAELLLTERRVYPRHRVDCKAAIMPLSGAATMRGQVRDLSLGGCLIDIETRVQTGFLSRVELQFELRGIAFRVIGVLIGSRGAKSFAMRFAEISHRKLKELEEVLSEVAEQNARKAAPTSQNASQSAATPAIAGSAVSEYPAPTPQAPRLSAGEIPLTERTQPLSAAKPATPAERRSHGRHMVDTRVQLSLVRSGISITGQIVNLSRGGCRLQTAERFPVGIYTRIEAEFYLHGLAFRLGGVIQGIMDRNTIGIRFLDMSDRKLEQLSELIAEIAEYEVLMKTASSES